MEVGTSSPQGERSRDDDIVDFAPDELAVGVGFSSEEAALKFLDSWAYKTFCPLVKVRKKLSSKTSMFIRVHI